MLLDEDLYEQTHSYRVKAAAANSDRREAEEYECKHTALTIGILTLPQYVGEGTERISAMADCILICDYDDSLKSKMGIDALGAMMTYEALHHAIDVTAQLVNLRVEEARNNTAVTKSRVWHEATQIWASAELAQQEYLEEVEEQWKIERCGV